MTHNSPSQWALPEGVENYKDFRTVWNLSLASQVNFPTLGQASKKSPTPTTQFVPSLPEIPNHGTLLKPFDSPVQHTLNAENWDKFVGPRYEDRNGNVGRLTCAALGAVKLYIGRVSLLLKNGVSTIGGFKAIFTFNTGVFEVQIQTTPGDTDLLLSARLWLRGFLGDDSQKRELQHFYEMMDKSMEFDELAFHPFVQNSEGRLIFPVRCVLLLDGRIEYLKSQQLERARMRQFNLGAEHVAELISGRQESQDISWERQFNKWFGLNYSQQYSWTASFAQLAGYLGNDLGKYRAVWNEERAKILPYSATASEEATEVDSSSLPAGDRTKSPSSLVRFLRALPVHINNHHKDEDKLSEADIENKCSLGFYYINLALFEFMLQQPGMDLSSLENPRTFCQFDLDIKKEFTFGSF